MGFSLKDYLQSLEAGAEKTGDFFSWLSDFETFGAKHWIRGYLWGLYDNYDVDFPDDVDEDDYIDQLIDTYNLVKETSDWFNRYEDNLPIRELDEKLLNENIPPDLARAYRDRTNDIRKKYQDTYGNLLGKGRRKDVQIDFYNSHYEEISAAKALKDYSAKGERSKLRVLFNYNGNPNAPMLMMWTDDNDPIFSPSSIDGYVNGSVYSFKDIINSAYKIYVTDDIDNKIIRAATTADNERDTSLLKKADLLQPIYLTTARIADFVADYTIKNTLLSKDAVKDSGGFRRMQHTYEYRLLKDIQARYKRYLDDVKAGKETNDDGKALLAILHTREADYLERKAAEHDSEYLQRNKTISKKLAYLILVKYLTNKELKAAKDTITGEDSALRAHEYRRILDRIADCNAEIKQLADRLQALKNAITPDLEKDYNDLVAEKTDVVYSKYLQELAELNALRKEYGLPEESLDEALNKSYVRIFTVDKTGKESFIDGISDEDAAIEKAKAICGDYNNVYVIKVSEIDDDQDIEILFNSAECSEQKNEEEATIEEDITKPSIGQIVDDIIKKESLKESKSFDIKDTDAVVDAIAYKNIPDNISDELVVVDSDVAAEQHLYNIPEDKSIIECTSCKTKILVDKESLDKDETLDLYNIELMCPHCGAYTGYHLISEEPELNTEELPPESNEVESALAPADVDYIDLDNMENVVEESFEKLTSSYLTKLYENVENFKITSISQPSRKTLIVEGDIVGTNGRSVPTTFDLKLKENANHRVIFEALNAQLSDNDKAFEIVAKSENDSLLFESFSYNYIKKIDGNDVLIEGIEK